ncbi:hypothetical protein KIW84_042804 [Lathyrus oleraceus]|uniref:Retrotransposon gag domain-containing protein n=1 Tax=Pisum sativum TaxID=3888 RepID=A0A9D4XBV8_PEA|nr:hypothetical protein KIW84_042804 [Pisum sativum]
MPASSPVMSVPPLVVHTLPHVEDTIYHSEPSEGPDVYEKMDEMKDQFIKLRKEFKTLKGKDLSIRVLLKFAYLTGAALRWYMGLDSASVRTFNDLGEAFVKQYKYNMDMVPDRDQLSAPSDFTEMVNMGMRLEEGVSEGRLSKEEVSPSKKYESGFARKKEGETNAVSVGMQRMPHIKINLQPRQYHH